MIILSVDYGMVRSGIAVCDKLELLASPVCVLTQQDAKKLVKQVAELALQYKAEEIVVGYPKNMDGSAGERAQASAAFAQALQEESELPVTLRDERLTTVSAHQALNATNTRGKKRKKVVDAVSAMIILQEYLDYRRIRSNS